MNKTKIRSQDFLTKLALFNEMGPEELDRIAKGTSEVHVQRGETLFQRGDICTGFHTVIYGQIKLAFTSSQGSEKIIEIIGPGHSFGEAIMFMDKPYIVAAQALADTLLLHVSKSAVLAELEHDPLFARKMLAGLSQRLHGLISDVEAYSLYSGTQRVIGYLLQHGADADTQVDGQEIILPFSKAVLASRLNLTPEHFSRILHDLTENQLINVSGKNITILNIEKLRNYEG